MKRVVLLKRLEAVLKTNDQRRSRVVIAGSTATHAMFVRVSRNIGPPFSTLDTLRMVRVGNPPSSALFAFPTSAGVVSRAIHASGSRLVRTLAC